MERRGVVWIAPEGPVPLGFLVDPVNTCFWASWQEVDPGENVDIVGAEGAIEWGRQRADVVRIRLGMNTYFSAGDEHVDGLPIWPPEEPPGGWWSPGPEGWWPPSDYPDNAADRIRVVEPSIRGGERRARGPRPKPPPRAGR